MLEESNITEAKVIKALPYPVGKPKGDRSSASVEHLFTSLHKKLRVERTRMINELTGDGNVVWEQSMLAKRQPWKSVYRAWRKIKGGMAKA